MDGGIYFDDDGDFLEMTEELYDREALLQRDLADFPKLLAGDQMNTAEPRRWTLIAREASVPDKEGGNQRWSADHLFVDQDAVPTIVEVKRSTDTRGRREVAGQMLDYVSHATLYWEAADLRQTFEKTCDDEGVLPEQELAELLGDDEEAISGFWERIEANLRSGKVRLLFVADEIPSELKRIVEFLNEQMAVAEVLAVEVTPYTSGEKTAYVPRLYGQTEEARRSKETAARPDHDEDDFLEDVAVKESEGVLADDEATALRELYDFVREEVDEYDFGGTANVSVTARWAALGGSDGMFTLNSKGKIVFWQPANIYESEDCDWSHDALVAWYDEIASIPHIKADADRFADGDTSLPVDALVEREAREKFVTACRNFADTCQTQ